VQPADRLAAYAQLAVHVGAGLRAGQELLINAQLEHAPLVRAIAETAYAAGSPYVDVHYSDPWVRRALVAGGPEDSLALTPPWMIARLERATETGAALIAIAGSSNADVYAGLDQSRPQQPRAWTPRSWASGRCRRRAGCWSGRDSHWTTWT